MFKSISLLFAFCALSSAQSCTLGSFECGVGNTIRQCETDGNWVTIQTCDKDSLCMPNDYECVPTSRYAQVYKQVNGVEPSCIHGSFQCGENGTIQQCSFSKWITIATCGADARCMPNDFECIPLSRWEEVYSTVFGGAAPPCVNGTITCGSGNVIQQCSFGELVTLATCPSGTTCKSGDGSTCQ